ncbi:hypothetical protein TNCT_342491 [Trichonephila clavata]|uniref:Uncharacterized protein n=1 Tax=Trichonephila clavata TaxID=2740835 RepID=A0A8X6F694_TRICU|nr:hypothetical protein TNCT_342491 [Trichonephila clavata]
MARGDQLLNFGFQTAKLLNPSCGRNRDQSFTSHTKKYYEFCHRIEASYFMLMLYILLKIVDIDLNAGTEVHQVVMDRCPLFFDNKAQRFISLSFTMAEMYKKGHLVKQELN